MKRIILTFMLSWLSLPVFSGIDVKTYIPKRAPQYILTIAAEEKQFFPEIPAHHYIPGLIEQESCITLTHSRCFNPTSELKTSREQGVGLGQLTRAFRVDGSTRFDSLKDLRNQHSEELSELNWNNIRERPDLQIRSIMLMSRDNYKRLSKIKDPMERLKMSDAAYNAGLGRVIKDRTKCSLTAGCDPQVWDDNVEMTCTASHTPIAMYGNKSPCRINREHVYNVFELRMPKYLQFYNDEKSKPTEPLKHPSDSPKVSTFWDRRFYLDYFFKYD